MSMSYDKTFLLVPSSRSSVKVKVEYQGHNFQKMAIVGASVLHKHILFHSVLFQIRGIFNLINPLPHNEMSPIGEKKKTFKNELKKGGDHNFLLFHKFLPYERQIECMSNISHL